MQCNHIHPPLRSCLGRPDEAILVMRVCAPPGLSISTSFAISHCSQTVQALPTGQIAAQRNGGKKKQCCMQCPRVDSNHRVLYNPENHTPVTDGTELRTQRGLRCLFILGLIAYPGHLVSKSFESRIHVYIFNSVPVAPDDRLISFKK
jgi:hypothetical protein